MIRIVFALTLALAISPAVAQPRKAAPRQASIITIIQNWADQDVQAAIALATSVDGLPDPVGAACWRTWAGAGGVLKAHPLPLTLKLATDVEADPPRRHGDQEGLHGPELLAGLERHSEPGDRARDRTAAGSAGERLFANSVRRLRRAKLHA
jgi:hypothetical protein